MFSWIPLFEEMIEKIADGEWQIGEVVETVRVWKSLSDATPLIPNEEAVQLRKAYEEYQYAETDEQVADTLEKFMRVCEKTLR